jgi:hypothetical protein
MAASKAYFSANMGFPIPAIQVDVWTNHCSDVMAGAGGRAGPVLRLDVRLTPTPARRYFVSRISCPVAIYLNCSCNSHSDGVEVKHTGWYA